MYLRASKWLKTLYCTCLITSLITTVFNSGLYTVSIFSRTGWATGDGWMLAAATGFGGLLLLALMIYRVVTVVKLRPSLDAFVASKFQRVLRVIGIAGMVVGIVGALALFFVQSIALGIFGRSGAVGAVYLVVSVYAVMLVSGVGLPSLLLFELSRMVGFEANLHEKLKRMEVK